MSHINLEICASSVPGTHGRMMSRTVFEVRELIPHPKCRDLLTTGKRLFKGPLTACEAWVKAHEPCSAS